MIHKLCGNLCLPSVSNEPVWLAYRLNFDASPVKADSAPGWLLRQRDCYRPTRIQHVKAGAEKYMNLRPIGTYVLKA